LVTLFKSLYISLPSENSGQPAHNFFAAPTDAFQVAPTGGGIRPPPASVAAARLRAGQAAPVLTPMRASNSRLTKTKSKARQQLLTTAGGLGIGFDF
jgi:hypothetical protein